MIKWNLDMFYILNIVYIYIDNIYNIFIYLKCKNYKLIIKFIWKCKQLYICNYIYVTTYIYVTIYIYVTRKLIC